MIEKEKEAYPSYITCGGYIKSYTDKQAWRNSWENTDIEDRKKCLSLPNWDNEIFKEISWIDVEEELSIKDDCEQKKKELIEKANELLDKAQELKKQAENM